jgi:hypothetical protein
VKSEISRQRTAVHPERQRRPGRAEASVRVMALPWRLHDESLPDGVGQVLFQETPDVIVLTQINSGHLITNRLSPALAAIVPVVDASEHGGDGFNARRADIRIAAANKTAIADTLLMLQQPIARLRSLAPSVLQSNDPRVHLLARLFVGTAGSNRDAIPTRAKRWSMPTRARSRACSITPKTSFNSGCLNASSSTS